MMSKQVPENYGARESCEREASVKGLTVQEMLRGKLSSERKGK